jgi:predicted TIM-barrel fold metal-dependent hydrolase
MSPCIDAHVHIYDNGFWPAKWFDYVAEKWAHGHEDRLPEDIRMSIEPGMADSDGLRLVEQMNQAGVDSSVILNVDWELGMGGEASVSLDDIHKHFHALSVRHPGRLHLFAGIDPRRHEALDLLTRAFDHHGALGLKLYPPVGFHPYDQVALPL